eukprot:3508398-Prymnesium_polylepis.4
MGASRRLRQSSLRHGLVRVPPPAMRVRRRLSSPSSCARCLAAQVSATPTVIESIEFRALPPLPPFPPPAPPPETWGFY